MYLATLYKNEPDGISGNEDCGQMSAWYVLSSLGFYPVTPASNQYIIGRPLFDKASLNLENGKRFSIIAENNSDDSKYIASAELNGKPYNKSYLNHQDIINGGTLVFKMTNQPTSWGTKNEDIPITEITEHSIVPPPFIANGETAFKGKTEVELSSIDKEANIFYNIDDKSEFKKYNRPITINKNIKLSVYAERNGKKSAVISTEFYKIDPNLKITLGTEYANQYNAGGDNALIDGIFGTEDFRTGTWQGYWNKDVEATIDLGQLKTISSISTHFLQDQKSWILLPTEIEFQVSKDGKNFNSVFSKSFDKISPVEKPNIVKLGTDFEANEVRFIKVLAKKLGELPEWHLGHELDGRSWLFIDEIEVK